MLRELYCGTTTRNPATSVYAVAAMTQAQTRCLLLGAAGQLGFDLARTYELGGDVIRLTRAELDLCDAQAIRETLRLLRPTLLLNTASYNEVDRAEDDRAGA